MEEGGEVICCSFFVDIINGWLQRQWYIKKQMFETRNVYSQSFNFNYKAYRNLIISPLIVTAMTTFLSICCIWWLIIIQNYIKSFLSSNFVTNIKKHTIWHLLIQRQEWKCQNNMWNMLKVHKNKETGARSLTSSWFVYCLLWIYLTHYFGASIVDFEQLNTGWDL